jgi:MFS family permease
MFTQLGVGAGLLIANVMFLVMALMVDEADDAFLTWGWRIPFLFSALLVAIALYVRLNVEETPVFTSASNTRPPARLPLRDLFRAQTPQVILGAGCMIGVFGFSYMGGTYLAGYANTMLAHPRWLVLLAGAAGAIALMMTTAVSAALCDRIGRRPLILLGFTLAVPWGFVVMPLLDTGTPVALILGVTGTYSVLGIGCGPLASYIPELFHTRYRYTASGLTFNLGGILGGAIPPLIAAGLLTAYGSWAIGVMLALLALITLGSTLILRETRGSDIRA